MYFRTLSTLCLIAATAKPALAAEINLKCELNGDRGNAEYILQIVPPSTFERSRATWVTTNGPFELKIVRFNDTNLVARTDQKMSNWPDNADYMQFDVDRISGRAEVTYARHTSEEEKKKDKWAQFDLVLSAFTERGMCRTISRAF